LLPFLFEIFRAAEPDFNYRKAGSYFKSPSYLPFWKKEISFRLNQIYCQEN
jgi:hypothetical protein